MNDQVKNEKKRDIIALIIVGVIALIVGLFYVKAYIEAPRDLGPDLVYVGKQDYGNIFGFDQLPGSTYYFATSLDKESLTKHLSSAGYKIDPEHSGQIGDHAVIVFTKSDGAGVDIDYYSSANTVYDIDGIAIKRIDSKPHVIKIGDKAYPKLRSALQQAHLLK